MLNIPYEDIISKIKQNSKLTDEELQEKIKQKMEQLSDLISKEGAAHIVANELGIKLFDQISGKLQIKNILSGMRNVEVTGKVLQVYDVRSFQTEKRSGQVGSFIVADETGTIRVVAWGDQADNIKTLKKDDIVQLTSGYVRDNTGRKEIHLNEKSKLVRNPEGVTVGEFNQEPNRKNIKDLTENDSDIELLATIIEAYEPHFFEICPQCSRRVKEKDDAFTCATHQKVTPDFSYVMNCFLDDGTEQIRGVFFRTQMEQLLNKKKDDLLALKDQMDAFQPLKDDLLGTQIKITGRVKKNEMFDRIEFIANAVDITPDPKKELERLDKQEKTESVVEEVVE